ncbi:unnamed protein product, partial [Symbiodinium microadriaticum]
TFLSLFYLHVFHLAGLDMTEASTGERTTTTSRAVAGVLNTHYASHFRGSILTYLPPELQTPYDDEEAHETMEAEDAGTDMATIEGSGKVDGSTNANLHHASLANPDGTATEGTEETDEGPAYYYADTMMPISGDEDEAPRTTTGRPSGSGRGSAPTNKAKSSRYNADSPAFMAGLWSLFNILLFHAGLEERSTKDNGDLRHGSGGYSFGHSTFDLSGYVVYAGLPLHPLTRQTKFNFEHITAGVSFMSDHQHVWQTLHITALNTWHRPKWNHGAKKYAQPTVQIDREKLIVASKHCPHKRLANHALTEAEALANDARRLWSLFRNMRAHRYSLAGIFTAWRQWAEFSSAQRIYKARAKQRSKQRKTDLLCQAQQAADKGNAHELWKTVILLAPKAPRKRLQLHKNGHMITPEEELEWILEAYGERCATDDTQAHIQFEIPEHAGFQLNSADLQWMDDHLRYNDGPTRMLHYSQRHTAGRTALLTGVCSLQGCAGPLRPGVQISLDLSAAFDMVEWAHIKQALDFAEVDIAVQEVLLLWLTQVRYVFRHRNLQGAINPRRGLRQGCTASPILWAAFTSLLCASIEAKTQPGWTRQHLCLYADDSHLRFRFDSYTGFEQAMDELRIVFACFRQLSLRINMEKTKAILKMVGTLKHRIKKDYIRKTTTARRLLLCPRDPERWLPLVDHTEYLGMIISYDGFEQQSLKHRLTKAHNRRWALASVLHSRRLRIPYNLNIWRSCVYSTMNYGVAHCGLSGAQVGELQKAVMKHTRAIISNQAFLTGDTHESIMQRFSIPKVQEDLRKELNRTTQAQLNSSDWMYNSCWQEHLHRRLDQHIPEPDSDLDERHEWACPFCETGEADMEEFFGPLNTGNTGAFHLLQQPNKRRRPPAGSFREPQQPDLLLTLARQVVKQEEEIKLLKQDHSLVLFFRPGEHSMLGFLYKTAKEFKAKQEANPQWTPGQQPLKAVMALALFTELGNRLQLVCQDQAKATEAKELGWRDPTVGWKYQRWNVQLKALEEDTSRPPLDGQGSGCAHPKALPDPRSGCRASVPLYEEAAGDKRLPGDIPDGPLCANASSFGGWGALLALQGSTVLQLGGFAYKRESLKPSPAMAKLKEMLRGR